MTTSTPISAVAVATANGTAYVVDLSAYKMFNVSLLLVATLPEFIPLEEGVQVMMVLHQTNSLTAAQLAAQNLPTARTITVYPRKKATSVYADELFPVGPAYLYLVPQVPASILANGGTLTAQVHAS